MTVDIYGGMFVAAFVAATLLPAQSEALLAALLQNPAYDPWLLIAVASIGNTLGALVNWGLGRSVETLGHRKWFPLKEAKLEKAQGWYRKYGRWSLFLSWAPFIGDALTLAAGVMRENFWIFLSIVGFAKTARYLAIAAMVL